MPSELMTSQRNKATGTGMSRKRPGKKIRSN